MNGKRISSPRARPSRWVQTGSLATRAATLCAMGLMLVTGGCPRSSEQAADASPTGRPGRLTLDRDTEVAAAKAALEAGRPNDAVGRLWPVVQEHPKDLDARVLLASAYELAGRHADAQTEAERALAIEPAARGALLTLSAALAGQREWDRAIAMTRRLLKGHPGDPAALQNLASFCAEARDWPCFDQAMTKRIAQRPDDMDLRVDQAKSLLRRGLIAKARTALEAAVQRVPRHAEAQLLLAACLYEQGHVEQAMDRADIATRIDPEAAKAVELFRAAFYVAVARDLTCRFGPRPWTKAHVEEVLGAFRRQGLEGAEGFYEIDRALGERPDVQARVAAAASRCAHPKAPSPAPAAPPPKATPPK